MATEDKKKKPTKAQRIAARKKKWGGDVPPWLQKIGAALPLEQLEKKAYEFVIETAELDISGIEKHESVKDQLKVWLDDEVFSEERTRHLKIRLRKLPVAIPAGELGTDLLIQMLDISGMLDGFVAKAYVLAKDNDKA